MSDCPVCGKSDFLFCNQCVAALLDEHDATNALEAERAYCVRGV